VTGTSNWRLRQRVGLSGGEVAYDVFGDGPSVILVHGTPSRSYIWRNVVPKLADRFTVYVFDLLGFGESERREGLNVSIAAQARLFAELVESWGLEAPAVAGHDIGGGIVLRAHLVEGVKLSRIALADAVVLRPWITPTTRHVKAHVDVYRTMPTGSFEAIIAAHLRTASYYQMDEEAFVAYLDQWRGEIGQKIYLQKDAQLDEEHTAEFEFLLRSMKTPVHLLWGERDAWLDPTIAERLRDLLPNADLELIPNAGHFSMEDDPEGVADALARFFNRDGST
jgi:pimeloyl-ACP methyl ester carboxylesterase